MEGVRRAGRTVNRHDTHRCFPSTGGRRRPVDAGKFPRLPPDTVRAQLVRTITIANQKGGCGKTTVAINLSASIAREGRRTLLIDLDPQGHCALGMAVPYEQIDLSIHECLLGQIEGEPVELSRITWQITPNLDLAPSRTNLGTLEPKLGEREGAECLLRDLLEANAGRYDYCLVDSPPHLGLLMKNGLLAADDVIIPVDTGYFSLHGLTQQLATIEQISERNGRSPSVRVLPNQYDVRTKLAREVLAELAKRFQGIVYETIVNFNTKLKEGASFGQPITEFAPTSMGARDFQRLAREILASEPSRAPTADILQHVERLAADAERLLATTTTLVDNRNETRSQTPVSSPVHTPPPVDVPAHPPQAEPATSAPEPRRVAAPTGAPSPEPMWVPAPAQASMTSTPQVAPTPAPSVAPAATTMARTPPESVPPSPVVSHEEIDQKIEEIYGVRQQGEIVIFRSHNPEALEIQLAGDFNDWMPHTTPMRRMGRGDFEARLRLPKGRYRYRLVIDGHWSHDLHNPRVETNEYGELNSIVEIPV